MDSRLMKEALLDEFEKQAGFTRDEASILVSGYEDT